MFFCKKKYCLSDESICSFSRRKRTKSAPPPSAIPPAATPPSASGPLCTTYQGRTKYTSSCLREKWKSLFYSFVGVGIPTPPPFASLAAEAPGAKAAWLRRGRSGGEEKSGGLPLRSSVGAKGGDFLLLFGGAKRREEDEKRTNTFTHTIF